MKARCESKCDEYFPQNQRRFYGNIIYLFHQKKRLMPIQKTKRKKGYNNNLTRKGIKLI
jgi:hypothetical protein